MKQKLLTVVAGAALSAVPMLSSAETSVYGRINTDFEQQTTQGVSRSGWILKGDSSRIGWRITEDLGEGMQALAGAEFEFSSDSDKSLSTGWDDYRNVYVGLSGNFGAFLLGKFDSASPAGSPLYTPIVSSISFVNQDSGTSNLSKSTLMMVENRPNNSIGWRSPKFGGGFEGMLRYSQIGPEDVATSNTQATAGAPVLEQDVSEWTYAVNYSNGPLYASVGGLTRSEVGGFGANAFNGKWQVLASYNFGVAKVFGFIAQDQYSNPGATARSSSNYYVANVMFPVGKWEFIATYLNREVQADNSANNWVQQLGVGYNLSKQTRAYSFYDVRTPNTTIGNNQTATLGFGLRHNF